jgi:CRP/FNR family transcriptional regulator
MSANPQMHAPIRSSRGLPLQLSPTSRWREALALVEQAVPFTRRIVHAGDAVQVGGQQFSHLHLINAGVFKTVNNAADGRGQVVGLHFRGDWLGFDGIADGRYGCDAIAVDTGEVWAIRYTELLTVCAHDTGMMHMVHAAMSGQITRESDALLSMGTLPADARVANFLRDWALSLAMRGQRNDQIILHLTRAEIGNHLGMTLETVSRVLARLAKRGVIRFDERDRRAIAIPSVEALDAVVEGAVGDGERRAVH